MLIIQYFHTYTHTKHHCSSLVTIMNKKKLYYLVQCFFKNQIGFANYAVIPGSSIHSPLYIHIKLIKSKQEKPEPIAYPMVELVIRMSSEIRLCLQEGCIPVTVATTLHCKQARNTLFQ